MAPAIRRPAVLAGVLLTGALLTGCGSAVPGRAVVAPVPAADLALIREYVDRLNAAGEAGADAQTAFLRSTQEPATPFPRSGCLGRVTLQTELVERTVRPDPGYEAPRGQGPPVRPAGAIYVAAVGVSASQGGVAVREEIGSKHLVIRDGRVYGYSPCPE